MADKRNALSDNLDALASDLKSLFETIVHDPKEQARKERRWRVLYTVTGAVFTLAARRLAMKAWSLLTGEEPPTKKQAQRPPKARDPERAAEQSEPEPAPTSTS